ncbi:MAG: hypothetical protein Q4D54_05005 [Eubacteriales bacterium]|nr:hypothetical protein [Eubacteriales bacterium]
MQKSKHNKGSAMLIAIIVSVVVVAFCLSLLLVCYSLYASAVRKVTSRQCKELAKSLSIELEQELTKLNFASYEEEKLALERVSNGENSLWFYLRYNLFQENWPGYKAEYSEEQNKLSYREFTLDLSGGDSSRYEAQTSDITLCVYWKNEDVLLMKEETLLCVEVHVTKDDQSAIMRNYFTLSVSNYPSTTLSGEIDTSQALEIVNPSGYSIDEDEHWKWNFQERD